MQFYELLGGSFRKDGCSLKQDLGLLLFNQFERQYVRQKINQGFAMNIKDFLSEKAIILGLEADSSEEVIRELGGKLRDLGYVKDNFIEAALEREANLPTGLPLGGEYNAAIPHVDIEYVFSSALGLATLKNEVVFYNMVEADEEVPCRLVIMLALDQPKSQIEMLQSVAAVLQSPDIVSKLVNAETTEEVYSILS